MRRTSIPGAAERVKSYFSGPGAYTGRSFERTAGGGDRPEVANQFTGDAVVAVLALNGRIPVEAAVEVLEIRAEQFSWLPAQVPNGPSLREVGPEVVNDDSFAEDLWRQVKEVHGIGSVTAGKLLARKRPHLIPVWDEVVGRALGEGRDWWLDLQAALQDPDSAWPKEGVSAQSGVAECVSPLRLVDVTVCRTYK